MNLYIIRHWETLEWNNNIILGNNWWTLSEKWVQEAHRIWELLSYDIYNIWKIITSNLARAINTWEIINKYIKVPTIQNKIINERNSWIAEWKKESEINWDLYEKKSLPYRKHFNWESFIDVKKRAKKFLNNIQENKNILVISHSVYILMLLSIIKKIPIKDALKIDIKNKLIHYSIEGNELKIIDL